MNVNDIKTLIKSSNEGHPLKKSLNTKTHYYKKFEVIIDDILKSIGIFSESDMKNLLIEKLQLGKENFKLETYYQGATELSIIYKIFKISTKQKGKFEYEKCVNETKKKIECFLCLNPYKVNIEAKCPVLKYPEYSHRKCITYIEAGRLPEYKGMFDKVKSIEESNTEVEVKKIQNKDNTLKDFLQNAHSKFSDFRNENELNVLFVSLGNKFNIMQWWNYLYGNEGLLTASSFVEQQTFSRVDVIIYTNLLYRHRNNETINGNAWDLDDSFNLFMSNQFRQTCNRNHSDCKKEVHSFLLSHIKSLMNELCDFSNSRGKTFICEITDKESINLNNELIIPSFISELEKNGKFYFAKSK